MRDLLIYIVIGVSFVALLTVWALYVPASWSVQRIDAKWGDLLLWTAFLFGLLIKSYKRNRGTPRFKVTLSAIFAVHALAFVALFNHSKRWPLGFDAAVFTGEYVCLATLIYFILGIAPHLDV